VVSYYSFSLFLLPHKLLSKAKPNYSFVYEPQSSNFLFLILFLFNLHFNVLSKSKILLVILIYLLKYLNLPYYLIFLQEFLILETYLYLYFMLLYYLINLVAYILKTILINCAKIYIIFLTLYFKSQENENPLLNFPYLNYYMTYFNLLNLRSPLNLLLKPLNYY
jgi:hypothetical protein